MTEILKSALPMLFGGLAIFIFGMNYMGEGLQKSAGEKMRQIIKILTVNPFVGILVGALVTAVIQSSSATTVMVIGFVSAGLMTVRQSIGVIMGANIGTTMTAWLVSIKISNYAYPIAFIGFIMLFFINKQKIKHLGQVIFGFGLLFVGLNIMSSAMSPLASSDELTNLMANVAEHKLLGITIGSVATAIVQSSSAVIAIIQKLATSVNADGTALITLSAAIPMVLGSNIGTTVTALLASIGGSRSSKRAALVHTVFNISGSVIFMFLVSPAASLITLIIGGTPTASNMDVAIAQYHTLFNVTCTILFLPFIRVLEMIVYSVIRGTDQKSESALAHIDVKVLHTPAIAMDLAVNELVRMSHITQDLIAKARWILVKRDTSLVEEAYNLEDETDQLKNSIINYLSRILSSASLTESQSIRLTGMMHMAHAIERIGDNSKDIVKITVAMINDKVILSDNAIEELTEAFNEIESIVADTIFAFQNDDIEMARKVVQKEDYIDNFEMNLRQRHIERLNRGECHTSSTISYIELIHYIERMSDSCKNIAESVIDDLTHKLFGDHDQLISVKEPNF